jgi:cytochrome c oxidase cbb3-type subunit 4
MRSAFQALTPCATFRRGAVFLLIGIAAFVGVVVWVFARRRKARFDEDARIPLDDGKR